jgi:glycine/D-amino acid oxidase-like deaminating enzyme
MRVAVIGAGLAGIATCWNLLPFAEVTLFDPCGIAGGASGVASGLLHPFVGMHFRQSLRTLQALAATKKLLTLVPFCWEQKGMLRLAVTATEEADLATRHDPETEWWPAARCASLLRVGTTRGGLFLSGGLTVRVREYLEGLWSLCEKAGATLIRKAIRSLDEVEGFDAIVVATGASNQLTPDSPVCPLKGQVLQLEWPQEVTPPTLPIMAQKYLILSRDRRSCFVGATFEREYKTASPEPEVAARELLPFLRELYPPLAAAPIQACFAGIRAMHSSRRPFVERINARTVRLAGLGSRGLLYHALLAEEVAAILVR